MTGAIPAVDEAIAPTRALLDAARVDYKLIGGLAVIHHGYARLTVDIDVIVERGAHSRLEPLLAEHGFSRSRHDQLRHDNTGVRVDVLEEGVPMARPGAPAFPAPASLAASPSDRRVVALAPLIALKLHARRLQDLADVGALIMHLDEIGYTALEAATEPGLRPLLSRIRAEALDELAMETRR